MLSRLSAAVISCMALFSRAPSLAAAVDVGDAYAREGDAAWTIGTGSVEMSFRFADGKLLLTSFVNKLIEPRREYVSAPIDPIGTGVAGTRERFSVETIWEKPLPAGARLDLAEAGLKLDVKKGEMVGFAVGPRGNYAGDQTEWISGVAYAGGEAFASTDDPKVEQGPVWHYAINEPGTGFLEFIDSVEWAENVKQLFRIPSEKSGFRAPGLTPHVGSTVLHPSPEHDAVRIWKAPKDGTVTLSGKAGHVGGGDVDLKVLRIRERPEGGGSLRPAAAAWALESGKARAIEVGGRPAVGLAISLRREELRLRFQAVAHPGTPVLRLSCEVDNAGAGNARWGGRTIFTLPVEPGADPFTLWWMVGGNSQPDQGKLLTADVGAPFRQEIRAGATTQFVPWMALGRKTPPGDGCFLDIDFLGSWRMDCVREARGPAILSADASQIATLGIEPGRTLRLPTVTVGVFRDDLDDLGRRLHDWQYEYLWGWTHDDWYALMPFTVAWYGDSDNLQQQFAGHLGDLDMGWTDHLRTVGMELLWEDAGWSASRHWWEANMEGPDFSQTRRFLEKNGMKLIVWIPGHQTHGLLASKVAAWGDFQRRTDGMGFDAGIDQTFRGDAERFLREFPRSSFHTCSGGSTYAHTFDVQALADVNYDSDGPGSDYTNAYWSYRETPDRWFDNLNCFYPGKGVFYNQDTGRRFLTQCPKWGLSIEKDDREKLRQVCDTYHYLLEKGTAGRWSRVAHPRVEGDDPRHYFQRVSRDGKRSIIILKHRAPGRVSVFPRGLLPGEEYVVDFEVRRSSAKRTGADLMEKGIAIENQAPGELICMNLPRFPRSGQDKTAPRAPGQALARREVNIGHTGVGIWWSPGSDDSWISFYEVRRGEEVLGKAATGTYYFDHSKGWDPAARYAVRTVDGDGNRSGWTEAAALPDEPLSFSALGGLFPESGRDGWRAEAATGSAWEPMRWVPPAKPPSADLGGTTIQPGGAEGYWEGTGGSKVGRGWQGAAKEAACSRTWIAPTDGSVRVVGRAAKEYYHRDQGGALRVRIEHEGKTVWPDGGWAELKPGDLIGASHDVTLDVRAGQALRFVLDRGAAPEHDLVAWMPTISYRAAGPVPSVGTVVRILCGADADHTDPCGRVWSSDRYFEGGRPMRAEGRIEPGAGSFDDEALYRCGRAGEDFSYSIPVPPGVYCIRLKFAEPERLYAFERPMDIDLNGRRAMRDFDIRHAAGTPLRAHDRLVRHMIPDETGKIVLRFRSAEGPLRKVKEAIIQAIEVTPELKPIIRIDAGAGRPFVDWNGFIWEADAGAEGGVPVRAEGAVAHASPTLYDAEIYRTARKGKSIHCRIPVPPGLYQVQLKFAEMGLPEPGRRPMDIAVNGRTLWKSWDPATQAGKVGMSADLRALDVAPDASGAIEVLVSAAGGEDAILQGILIE
jgi:hypothetical protein